MTLHGRKRRIKHVTLSEGRDDIVISQHRYITTQEASTRSTIFTLYELPVPIIYDILSRLPLLDIFRCRCVCKMLRKLLKDPYFSKIHLSKAPTLRTYLIFQNNFGKLGALHFFSFDFSESTLSSCDSSEDQNIQCSVKSLRLPKLSEQNSDFSFRINRLNVVGACNGLLCLYSNPPSEPFYAICNPILGEFIRLPQITESYRIYAYAKHSSFFGYCPRTEQYKVISFMDVSFAHYKNLVHSTNIIAYIHTLGSDSWKRIENAPCPKRNSFDPFFNGALHWITHSGIPSELICSYDLEMEEFEFLSPPAHFVAWYLNKISWINVGVLRGCLCICYIYEDVRFDVWVMKEYGVQGSWTKEFSIDMKFYCKLRIEDLHRPIKFLGNGDLWFISSSNSLVSFNPRKRTFKELRSIGSRKSEVIAHDLSFVSLKDVVRKKKTGKTRLVHHK